MNNNLVLKALLLIVTAIILGAFGAHYFENILEPKQLNGFKTGVSYQQFGGLILLIVGLNANSFKFSSKFLINLFFLGVCLFSFSIYAITIFHSSLLVHYLWPVTPIGGLLMIVSLAVLSYRIWKSKN